MNPFFVFVREEQRGWEGLGGGGGRAYLINIIKQPGVLVQDFLLEVGDEGVRGAEEGVVPDGGFVVIVVVVVGGVCRLCVVGVGHCIFSPLCC